MSSGNRSVSAGNKAQRTIVALACLAGLVATGGCPLPEPLIPENLPAELDAVVAARASVTVLEDDPLLELDPGTVVDDLSGLDGCWGAYHAAETADFDSPYTPGGTTVSGLYEFYRIDLEAGTISQQALKTWTGFPMSASITYHGTIEQVDVNRLRFRIETVTAHVWLPTDGWMERGEFTAPVDPEDLMEDDEELELPDGEDSGEYLVTLDGDRMLLVPTVSESDAGSEMPDGELSTVYVRIDCP